MSFLLVLTYGISLSMDAFAVAICKGIALGKPTFHNALKVGVYFGLFQGLMPLIGYFLANAFIDYIQAFDHWIAFILLSFIGIKMIWECSHPDGEAEDKSLSFKNMVILSIATSIDALAVGIAFSCDGMSVFNNGSALGIYTSCIIICATTLMLSTLGVKIGKILENKFKKGAELAGGIVLVLLGIKILVEHLTGISILGI